MRARRETPGPSLKRISVIFPIHMVSSALRAMLQRLPFFVPLLKAPKYKFTWQNCVSEIKSKVFLLLVFPLRALYHTTHILAPTHMEPRQQQEKLKNRVMSGSGLRLDTCSRGCWYLTSLFWRYRQVAYTIHYFRSRITTIWFSLLRIFSFLHCSSGSNLFVLHEWNLLLKLWGYIQIKRTSFVTSPFNL